MHFILFLLAVKSITCARILGIFPTPFYSHQSVFQPIWRELTTRGHEVTVITPNPIRNASLSTLKEIDLSFTYKLAYEDHKMQEVLNTETNLLVLMKLWLVIMNNMTSEQLQHPQVQELIKSDQKFDLMIVEAHVPGWFGFVKKFKCPLILITSMEPTNFFRGMMGNVNNPVLTPSFNLPFDNELTFWQRVVSLVFEIFDDFQNNYLLYPIQQRIIRQGLNNPDINLFEIFKTVSLMFTSPIPGFSAIDMDIPSVVQLNGLQIRQSHPLPKALQEFLDGSTEGAIFFSLGSTLKSYLISEDKQDFILKVFEELPFKVIWKFEGVVKELPKNVKVVTWAPQQDILRHKNTKLFITHGGIQSLDEAIRFRVPILGFPFFGDQFYNVRRMKHLQLGTWLDFKTLTKERFKEAILETINNETYAKNLKEISGLMHQPMSSLDKTVWWVEYVIRHGQNHHLRAPLADISLYQYYLLDVIFTLLLCLTVLIVILLKIGAILLKSCSRKQRKVE